MAAAITVMLIFTLGLYLAYRTDKNPVDYEFGEGIVKIKNKFGNVIWTAEAVVSSDRKSFGLNHLKLFCRILDIDGDGKNEVLISEAKIKEGEHRGKTGLVCMRAPDDILWSYYATDTVKSIKEPLIPVEYSIKIIDTVTINDSKQLYIFIHNNATFPSAVYALDAKTGKKTGGTVWSSGHICQAGIFDYNSDGKYELFFARRDNGFHQNYLHMAELPLKTGQIRSTDPYRLLDIDYIDLPLTILAPDTDYPNHDVVSTDYLPPLVMGYPIGEDLITFQISHLPYHVNCGFSLKLHKDLINTTIIIWGQFRSDRDSLVKAGILPPPYTDTPEYIDILQKQIKIWKYGKRVR